MQFMMVIKGDKDYEAGVPPDPRLMAAIGKHTEEMIKAGVVLATAGLEPSAKGALLRASGGTVRVVDGPFAEAKELIGGFAIIRADSKAEAIRLGTEFLALHQQILGPTWEGECEVREVSGYSPAGIPMPCAQSNEPLAAPGGRAPAATR
jgi:hypothetical protein